jgi:hypothetical protein
MPGPNLWRSTRVLHIQVVNLEVTRGVAPQGLTVVALLPPRCFFACTSNVIYEKTCWGHSAGARENEKNQRQACPHAKRASAHRRNHDHVFARPLPPVQQGHHLPTAQAKQLPAFKIGSDWRFSRPAIDEWIAQHEITNPAPTRGRKPKLS